MSAEIHASPKELSPHPEDKPAPLFAKKATQPDEDSDALANAATGDSETTDLTEAPRTDESESNQAVLNNNEEPYHSAYVVDIDGSPVVGDLLKMMFVEHRVVPTILVSTFSLIGRLYGRHAQFMTCLVYLRMLTINC